MNISRWILIQLLMAAMACFSFWAGECDTAPQAVADSAVTDENTPILIDVIANDQDPDGDPLTLVNLTAPARGTVVANSDGTVTYTPQAGFPGTYSFTYRLSHSETPFPQATVSVTVTGGQPPAGSGPLAYNEGDLYFTNSQGKAVFLTGSHVWNSFIDWIPSVGNPPIGPLDYEAYLDWMEAHNHNFFRGWVWEHQDSIWRDHQTTPLVTWVYQPLPWVKVGQNPNGTPRFDLNQINPAYLNRLRTRIEAARDRGIYVGVMLFQGITLGDKPNQAATPVNERPWHTNPFNSANNVNGINPDLNGDGNGWEVQTLATPSALDKQKLYIRAVIDTLYDLDNVIWEISNESLAQSHDWQQEIIAYIRSYEASMSYPRHPVWQTTVQDPTVGQSATNATLNTSAAEAVSYRGSTGNSWKDGPPINIGVKVSLLDTDHVWGIGGYPGWVWKVFTRGHQAVFMDPYYGIPWSVNGDLPEYEQIRLEMGDTLRYAERMNLIEMLPDTNLSSTGYALVNPGIEYLIYQPNSGSFSVNLIAGTYDFEWFNPDSHQIVANGQAVYAGGSENFTPPPPINGDAVLYLKSASGTTQTPFTGVPIELPARFQAEDFDNGGAGIAYQDTSPGNSGNQYRTTDVDIENCQDTGAGFNVAYITDGEWLEYTVHVASAGNFDFDLRVAADPAASPNGIRFHLEIDGMDVSGPVITASTSGFQDWKTVTLPNISLASGDHVMRIGLDSLGWNLNWVEARVATPAGFQITEDSPTGALVSAGSTVPAGAVEAGSTLLKSFYIHNPGSTALTIANFSATGSAWSVDLAPPGSIGAGASAPFRLKLQTSQTGSQTSLVAFQGGTTSFGFNLNGLVLAPLTVTAPTPLAVNPGDSAVFQVTASGGSGSYLYQWRHIAQGGIDQAVAGANFQGANTAQLTIISVAQANLGGYYCAVTDANNPAVSANSATAGLTFPGPVLYTIQTSFNVPINHGDVLDAGTFVLDADPIETSLGIELHYTGPAGSQVNYTITPVFQDFDWQRTFPTGVLAPLSTSHIFQFLQFQMRTDVVGVMETEFKLVSNDPFADLRFTLRGQVVNASPSFAEQPQSQRVPVGGTAQFHVVATGGTGSYHYQWYKRSPLGLMEPISDNGHFVGTATDTLTILNVQSSDYTTYQCGVRNAGDPNAIEVRSDDASLLAPLPYDAHIVSNTIPDIMGTGDSVNVSVTVRNTGSTVWTQAVGVQLGAVGGSDPFAASEHALVGGVSVAYGEEATFTFPFTAPATAGSYLSDWRMNRNGANPFGDTLSKTVQVVQSAPIITGQPDDENLAFFFPDGTEIPPLPQPVSKIGRFTVTAGGALPRTYQWFRVGNSTPLSDGPGPQGMEYAQTSTNALLVRVDPFQVNFQNGSHDFYCVVSNAFGTATSNQANLYVVAAIPDPGPGDVGVADTFLRELGAPNYEPLSGRYTEIGKRYWSTNSAALVMVGQWVQASAASSLVTGWVNFSSSDFLSNNLLLVEANLDPGDGDWVCVGLAETPRATSTWGQFTPKLLLMVKSTGEYQVTTEGTATVLASGTVANFTVNEMNLAQLWYDRTAHLYGYAINGQILGNGLAVSGSDLPFTISRAFIGMSFGSTSGTCRIDDFSARHNTGILSP